MSPEQLLGQLETNGRVVIADLEAGVGTISRMQAGNADVVLVIAEPSAKSIEAARRAMFLATPNARVLVVANRVRDEADVEAVRSALGAEHEVVVVPEDPAIVKADRHGVAPIDSAPESPGVAAIIGIAMDLVSNGQQP